MTSTSRKRKHEELEEEDPYSCIRWADPGSESAETLPMELWFKVFQYYCAAMPCVDYGGTKTLMQHPIIAEILDRFLPYLGGATFTEIQESCKRVENWDTSGCGFDHSGWYHSADLLKCRDRHMNYRGWRKRRRMEFHYYTNGLFGGISIGAHFMVTLCTGATIRFAVDSIYIYPGGLSDLVIRDLNYLLPHGCFVARIRDFRRYITDYEGFVGIWVPYPPNKRDCKGKRYKLVCQLRPLQAKILHYDKDFLYIPPWRLR